CVRARLTFLSALHSVNVTFRSCPPEEFRKLWERFPPRLPFIVTTLFFLLSQNKHCQDCTKSKAANQNKNVLCTQNVFGVLFHKLSILMVDWGLPGTTDFLSSFGHYGNREAAFSHSLHKMNGYTEDESITVLNQELTGLGLEPVSRDEVTASLIDRLEEVVRLYQRSNRIKEDLENRLHQSSCDVTEQQTCIRRLRSDKERLEKELAQEAEKSRQAKNKTRSLTAMLKTEKDELRRLQSVIKDRDGQFKHELKKKQREVNKLMERLHQLLMDKNPDRRIDNKRSTWKHKANSNKHEEMYASLISHYEEKHQDLRVENSDLRDCLLDMQRELSTLAEHSSVTGQNGLAGSTASSDEDLSTGSSQLDIHDDCFQMPYDVLRENLQKSFQETCKRLKTTINKCSSLNSCGGVSGSVQDGELDKLKQQINKYKDIVKQQEQLIQQSLCTQSKSMENTFLQESQILQERETMSEQRRKFYQEKANFEEERKSVTECARKLQQERHQFEEEKACMLQSHLFQVTTGNKQSPSHRPKADKSRLLPSTPVFSPAPGKPASPASSDLIRYLSSPKKKSPLIQLISRKYVKFIHDSHQDHGEYVYTWPHLKMCERETFLYATLFSVTLEFPLYGSSLGACFCESVGKFYMIKERFANMSKDIAALYGSYTYMNKDIVIMAPQGTSTLKKN
ncbi:LOW QUALITY PROTEIN: ADIPB-like protein, partial [Mya arenaria]